MPSSVPASTGRGQYGLVGVGETARRDVRIRCRGGRAIRSSAVADFDRVLLDSAAATPAPTFEPDARARLGRVSRDEPASRGLRRGARTVERSQCRHSSSTAPAAPASSAAGSGLPQPGHRTYALVGVWSATDGWDLPDETHTVVETYRRRMDVVGAGLRGRRGTSARWWAARSPGGNRGARGRAIAPRSRSARNCAGCSAARRWSGSGRATRRCIRASRYAGPRFLLAGDAGSFIDPLSSFGVKKALASAWLGAIVVHTPLAHSGRRDGRARLLLGLGAPGLRDTPRRVARLRARGAGASTRHAFWTSRADVEIDAAADADEATGARSGRAARLRGVQGRLADRSDARRRRPLRSRPVVRGREIVLENALADGMRFVGNVDLVMLAGSPASTSTCPICSKPIVNAARRCRCRASSAACRCWSPEGFFMNDDVDAHAAAGGFAGLRWCGLRTARRRSGADAGRRRTPRQRRHSGPERSRARQVRVVPSQRRQDADVAHLVPPRHAGELGADHQADGDAQSRDARAGRRAQHPEVSRRPPGAGAGRGAADSVRRRTPADRYTYAADKDASDNCSSCHTIARALGERRTKEEWELLRRDAPRLLPAGRQPADERRPGLPAVARPCRPSRRPTAVPRTTVIRWTRRSSISRRRCR